LDLRSQIAVVRAWLPLFVVVVLLSGAAAFVFSNLQQKVYAARATLIVGQSLSAVNPDYNQLLVSQRLSATYASVATTRPNLDAVIKELGLGMTSDDLSRNVQAEAALDSTLLSITAQDTDPSRAAAIANGLAEQLIAASPAIQGRQTDLQKSIDAELKATQDQIAASQARVETLTSLPSRTQQQDTDLQTLNGQLATLRSTYSTLLSYSSGNASNLVSVIEPAVAPTSPVSPRTTLNVLLAAVVGLLVAAAIAATRQYVDDSLKTAEDVVEAAGLPTLGSITRVKGEGDQAEVHGLVTIVDPHSAAAEAYRTLRTNIEFASTDAPIRSLLVASPLTGEGRTVIAANLAVVFAQRGRRVLLVDADLRKPGIHAIFDLPNAHGLTTLLRSDAVDVAAVVHKTKQENLRILTTGPLPPNPAELLGSPRMRAIVERLEVDNDVVIFDSPPVQAVVDSAILSSFLDAALLVIDAGHSARVAVRQATAALAQAGGRVLGAVLNGQPDRVQTDYGYYGYDGYDTEAAVPVAPHARLKSKAKPQPQAPATVEPTPAPTPEGVRSPRKAPTATEQ
jgi:polysaccharide biosynthesis transport protein